MVGLGFCMLVLIAVSFYYCARRVFDRKRWLLKLIVFSMPAALDRGRAGLDRRRVRPPALDASARCCRRCLAASTLSDVGPDRQPRRASSCSTRCCIIAAGYLMVKFVRLGPSSLHTGRYFLEHPQSGL